MGGAGGDQGAELPLGLLMLPALQQRGGLLHAPGIERGGKPQHPLARGLRTGPDPFPDAGVPKPPLERPAGVFPDEDLPAGVIAATFSS